MYERFCLNLKDLIEARKVTPVRVNHAQTNELTRRFDPDMVFIDGDHSYAGVKRDIQNWLPRLAPGGMLCGHDWQSAEVRKAVTEALRGVINPSQTTIWSWTKV